MTFLTPLMIKLTSFDPVDPENIDYISNVAHYRPGSHRIPDYLLTRLCSVL